MSKGTKLFIGILITLVIVLGALLYRAETKMHDFADNAEFSSKMFLLDSTTVEMQIERLVDLKTDTGEVKEGMYQLVREDFQCSNAYQMFTVACMVTDVETNRDTLNAINQEFSVAEDPISTFFIMNDSISDVTDAELDQLIIDYRKLAAVTEKFKRMRLSLW